MAGEGGGGGGCEAGAGAVCVRETLGRGVLRAGAVGDEDEDEEEAGDMGGAAVCARGRPFGCSAGDCPSWAWALAWVPEAGGRLGRAECEW